MVAQYFEHLVCEHVSKRTFKVLQSFNVTIDLKMLTKKLLGY